MTRSHKIETSIGTHYIENNVLFIIIKEGAEIGVDEILESKQARIDLQQNNPIKVLVDLRGLFHITNEAREIAAEAKNSEMSIAMALVSNSLGTRLISNFFIKFNKPKRTTKMFNSKEKALNWLMQYKA